MAPIRFFKTPIEFVDSYHNFVFAADQSGRIGVFLLNENDLEDDDRSMLQREALEFEGSQIKLFKFFPEHSLLVAFGSNGSLVTYQVDQLEDIDMIF